MFPCPFPCYIDYDQIHLSYSRRTAILFAIGLKLWNLHEGKGPEKEKYEEKIRKLHLKRVAFRTMWLSAEDYPLLLGRFMFFCHLVLTMTARTSFSDLTGQCYDCRISRPRCLPAYFLIWVRSSNEGKYLI